MNAADLIMKEARSQMLKLGYSERDANETAVNAVTKYRHNTRHQVAIKDAVIEGKKIYTRVKK